MSGVGLVNPHQCQDEQWDEHSRGMCSHVPTAALPCAPHSQHSMGCRSVPIPGDPQQPQSAQCCPQDLAMNAKHFHLGMGRGLCPALPLCCPAGLVLRVIRHLQWHLHCLGATSLGFLLHKHVHR